MRTSPFVAGCRLLAREAERDVVVEAGPEPLRRRAAELWNYRELLYFLAWRDLKVRYKQTALGVLWAILQPLATMGVLSAAFGYFARVPSDGVPYPLFVMTALVPWALFTHALTQSSGSLVNNRSLVVKVFFPRLIIPLAPVLVGAVDAALAGVVLFAMMAFYGVTPGASVLALPVFALLAVTTALSVGVWLSALSVRYRDVRHAIPFLTQIWLLATPIAYPASLIPEPWRAVAGLNPMAGVVEGFRWALLGHAAPPATLVAVSTAAALTLLVTGFWWFDRVERHFADVI